MATSDSLNRFINDIDVKVLQCAICQERLKNPKSLGCLHSFCVTCLEKWAKKKQTVTCPICRKTYRIPEGGIRKLPPNTFVLNLIDTMETFSQTDRMKFPKFKESSVVLMEVANQCKKNLECGLEAVVCNTIKLEEHKGTSLRNIENHTKELIKIIRKNEKKMKNKVETIYSEKKKVNDEQTEELRTTISDINTKSNFLNQLLKSDSATAMQSRERVISALNERISQLPKTDLKDNGQISFTANTHQIALLQESDIGMVTHGRAADCLKLEGGESVTQAVRTKQSPIVIKVEKEGLINTIQVDKEDVLYVVKCAGNCLLVSCVINGIHTLIKYKQSGECISKVTLPQSMVVDSMYTMKNSNIAISDGSKYVRICNMNGEVIKSIGEGVLKGPVGIHVGEISNVMYVADRESECVFVFDIDSGEMIRRIGTSGQRKGQMSKVVGVTLTKGGQILVLDHNNSRLQLFDNEGRFIKVLVKQGDEDGKLERPWGIVVDEDDNIIITNFGNNKLQLFSSDGNFIKRIDKQEDGLNDPYGLSIISYHPRRVAVANHGDKTVKIFNY